MPIPVVLAIFGTRPEAVKLAPVIQALAAEPEIAVRIAVTGQHRQMLDQMLTVFSISPEYDLDVMQPGQTLSELTGHLLPSLDTVIAAETPSVVLVQGDTTTAFAASLAAFYRGIPVGHVEAGLRTHDRHAPFPEEINRRLISVLASWHFAPTMQARQTLLREGVPESEVVVTGNTVIDALRYILETTNVPPSPVPKGRRMVLVTVHRRENFDRLESVCRAIVRIAESHQQVEFCFPVHLNPNVRDPVHRLLDCHPRVRLLPPLDYVAFVHLLARADLVVTDSGGLQEEGPALGKPVLILRDVTERPEGVTAGVAELVGTDEERIVERVTRLLYNPEAYAAMARVVSPYGDGRASERILTFLRSRLLEMD